MKKISIITGLVFATYMFANAQSTASTSAQAPKKPGVPGMMIREAQGKPLPPGMTMTTGDKATDDQIKALNKEMEEKIKAIRDEYMAKMKALMEGKKPMVVGPNGATGTPKGILKNMNEKRDDMRKNMQNASGTPPKPQGLMQKFFNR